MSGICATKFSPDRMPETTLRMIMEKHSLDEDLRIAIANAGFLTAALVAAGGKDPGECVNTMVTCTKELEELLGESGKVMNRVKASAVWSECNEVRGANAEALAKVVEDPTKVPAISDTDFAKMRKDFMTAHPELRFDAKVERTKLYVQARNYWIVRHLDGG